MEALPVINNKINNKQLELGVCELEIEEPTSSLLLTDEDVQFITSFEEKVKSTIEKYSLFFKEDKILVAASGGKDSTVALYLLWKLGYNIEAINIDTGLGEYSCQNTINLEIFCKEHNIKLHKSSFRDAFGFGTCYIRDVLAEKGFDLNSCTICGVIRRVIMNQHIRKLGADKTVTGHNADDESEAVMMNFFRNNLNIAARQGPTSGIVKHELFVPRVKPLYFCTVKEITRYSKLKKFKVHYGACPCSADAYRNTLRQLFKEIEADNASSDLGSRDQHSRYFPMIKENILRNFVNILPKLKQHYSSTDNHNKINACNNCGEPTKNQICQACNIIALVK
ncbi:TPA: phosphoadenosine phosphosulfate reductase family protein [Candidatus Woesearchaeota archaeon]|nr:phosphoadenosine phosphosulfate reductase family protein [Candidatus Woesearchaeota archaeon]